MSVKRKVTVPVGSDGALDSSCAVNGEAAVLGAGVICPVVRRAAASKAMRSSSVRPNAAASSATVSLRGVCRAPRSKSLMPRRESPARSASSSWVSPAAWRARRKRSPKRVEPGEPGEAVLAMARLPSRRAAGGRVEREIGQCAWCSALLTHTHDSTRSSLASTRGSHVSACLTCQDACVDACIAACIACRVFAPPRAHWFIGRWTLSGEM